MFNNKHVVSKAIQSDLTVDPIAYSTISTDSTVDPILYTSSILICCHPSSRIAGTIHICRKATDIFTTIREAIYTFRRATDISTTIREAIYTCIFRRATDISTTIREAIYIFRRATDIFTTIREAIHTCISAGLLTFHNNPRGYHVSAGLLTFPQSERLSIFSARLLMTFRMTLSSEFSLARPSPTLLHTTPFQCRCTHFSIRFLYGGIVRCLIFVHSLLMI